MAVAVAFNADSHRKLHLNPHELAAEDEVRDTAEEVAAILGADLVGVGDDLNAALDVLRSYELVFNLCEGVLGNPRFEMHFALALEMLGIPFTGCDPVAVALCIDKPRVKKLLRAAGLPAPEGRSVSSTDELEELLSMPRGEGSEWIVKPAFEDAGIGIDETSVAQSSDQLRTACMHVLEHYRQPALVERFITGAEYNVAIYEGRVLPPGEVVFDPRLAPRSRVVGWKAKWASGSFEDLATVSRVPALLDPADAAQIQKICFDAWQLLGIGGYCRFDLRRDETTGETFIIDVNPQPDIGRGTGFRKALDAAGTSFPDFLQTLMMAARRRRQR